MSEEKSINYFEFREVCKSFDERMVLDHVSFTVKRGETCVIMGRSGVGKSVSLKHILGFLKPDWGKLSLMVRTSPILRSRTSWKCGAR